MISGNQKISQRQVGRMVILDWLAKATLLLPGFAAGADGRSFVLSAVFGVLLALAYAWLVGWIGKGAEQGFAAYAEERLGGGCARIFFLICFGYVFLNTVFLLRLFGVIAVTFILPEASAEVLMGVVLLGAVYMVSGGLEVRARVSEVLFSVIVYPLLLLLICAAFSTDSGYLTPGKASLSLKTAEHGLQVFMAFGGMGIFLFLTPFMNERGKLGRTLARSVAAVGLAGIALFLAAIGAFGEAGMRASSWPAVTLMSSAEIPGGFVQRWDVIFTGLLLASFFASAGAGLFYLRRLGADLFHREAPLPGPVMALLVYGGVLWCGSYETALRAYTIAGGYLCVPLLVLFTVLLAVVEQAKRRKL